MLCCILKDTIRVSTLHRGYLSCLIVSKVLGEIRVSKAKQAYISHNTF